MRKAIKKLFNNYLDFVEEFVEEGFYGVLFLSIIHIATLILIVGLIGMILASYGLILVPPVFIVLFIYLMNKIAKNRHI